MKSKSCSVIKVDYDENGNISVIGPKFDKVIDNVINENNSENMVNEVINESDVADDTMNMVNDEGITDMDDDDEQPTV